MGEYADRDVIQLDRDGGYYCRHVAAMTAEGLHSKADIAAELAWRDREIDRLRRHPQPVTPAARHSCETDMLSDCPACEDDARESRDSFIAESRGQSVKPVTPAGGEVVARPFCRDCADNNGTCPYSGEPCDPDERKTHPPVADAALPRGHSISDAKQALGVDESLNIEALRGLLSIYEKCPATGQREVIALKAAIAALNQRGGGDHG